MYEGQSCVIFLVGPETPLGKLGILKDLATSKTLVVRRKFQPDVAYPMPKIIVVSPMKIEDIGTTPLGMPGQHWIHVAQPSHLDVFPPPAHRRGHRAATLTTGKLSRSQEYPWKSNIHRMKKQIRLPIK